MIKECIKEASVKANPEKLIIKCVGDTLEISDTGFVFGEVDNSTGEIDSSILKFEKLLKEAKGKKIKFNFIFEDKGE